jgi:hypothetical protein
MVKKFLVLLSSLLMCFSFQAKADEGMWMLNIIGKRYEQMKAMGLELSPEQIYSINQSSLKDAVVNFGGFCTGEIISDKGLLLTNHHCGYERIQMHSTTEKNYLKDGFWAKNLADELPNSGLFVTFLVKIEDVTESLINLKGEALGTKMAELENEAIGDSHYTAEIKDFFAGNKYYLFTYETYTDVRLVGAPPSSVGKFGGDTDNWMWPRHTGDFALFRVYAGKDGKPAEYSKDNVPLKPKHFLPVSLDGVEENDFAMILGYPGSTERYLPTEGVKLLLEETNPARIKLREKRLAIMKAEMEKDAKIDLMYSPKYFQISNYYKYFIGQNRGIKNLNVIAEKRQEEADFVTWVNTSEQNQKEYGGVIQGFSEIYQSYKDVNLPYVYLNEGAFASDIMLLAYHMAPMYAALKSGMKKEQMQGVLDDMKVKAEEHFADYYAPIDQKILAAMLKSYKEDIASIYHPTIIQDINKKYKGNFDKYADYVFKKSILTTKEKTLAFIENPDLQVIEKDPAFEAMLSVLGTFRSTAGAKLGEIYGTLDSLNFLYLKGKQMMFPDSTFYPDANFTQRLTYGKVSGYWAQDGVYYNYYTTLKGVIEKENPLSEEFVVEPGIKELYEKKEYGQYANKDGELPVCFISNNDITGGNSGSPVINGKGHLIGTAFDGNWEAMSGDIEFSPKLQRTIITDIRYVLFIIDKYADAKHLIDEMEIIKTQ